MTLFACRRRTRCSVFLRAYSVQPSEVPSQALRDRLGEGNAPVEVPVDEEISHSEDAAEKKWFGMTP